jgi:hypothetical protein
LATKNARFSLKQQKLPVNNLPDAGLEWRKNQPKGVAGRNFSDIVANSIAAGA